MNKFSLIDAFTKLASDKNAINTLTNLVGGLVNGNKNFTENKQTTPTVTKSKYSQDAILSLLKKHEEMSKNIDLQNKNNPLGKWQVGVFYFALIFGSTLDFPLLSFLICFAASSPAL